jgi:hypothetical protein
MCLMFSLSMHTVTLRRLEQSEAGSSKQALNDEASSAIRVLRVVMDDIFTCPDSDNILE